MQITNGPFNEFVPHEFRIPRWISDLCEILWIVFWYFIRSINWIKISIEFYNDYWIDFPFWLLIRLSYSFLNIWLIFFSLVSLIICLIFGYATFMIWNRKSQKCIYEYVCQKWAVLFNIAHLISRSVILAFFEGNSFCGNRKWKIILNMLERHI